MEREAEAIGSEEWQEGRSLSRVAILLYSIRHPFFLFDLPGPEKVPPV